MKRIRHFIFIFLLFIIIFFTLKTFATERPAWIQDYMGGTFNPPSVYYGVSFAHFERESPDYDAMRLAKDRALDELCYQISVSIQSQFKEYITQKGDYAEQNVSSSLFVSTRKELSGIEEKERWTDPNQRCHWVLLVIDKTKADRQMKHQNFINKVVNRLDHKQDEILKGIEMMATMSNQKMKAIEDRINHLEELVERIATKLVAASSQTKNEYAPLQLIITQLENILKAHNKQPTMQINKLIHQNQIVQNLLTQIYERIQSDYFLAFANNDITPNDNNDEFWVRIEPLKGQGADYYKGEVIKFRVRTSKACYIKIIYLSSTGDSSEMKQMENTIIFPNEHDKDNTIKAGVTKIIGKMGELEVTPPFGKDVVTVVASEHQFTDLEDILNSSTGSYYSEVTSNTRGGLNFRDRGIAVKQPTRKSVATDTCFIVSHFR